MIILRSFDCSIPFSDLSLFLATFNRVINWSLLQKPRQVSPFLEAFSSVIKGDRSSILLTLFPLMSRNVSLFKVLSFLTLVSLLSARFKQCRLTKFSMPSNLPIFKLLKFRQVTVCLKCFYLWSWVEAHGFLEGWWRQGTAVRNRQFKWISKTQLSSIPYRGLSSPSACGQGSVEVVGDISFSSRRGLKAVCTIS